MRARSLLTLLIGLVLAGAAVYYVDQRLTERDVVQVVAAEPAMALAVVVVARRDLARGDVLRADALKEMQWPANSVPVGAFASIEEILGDGSQERRARRSIVPGEPVLADKVSGFGGRDTLGETLSPGKRAFSIRVNDVSGVAGFLLPGDRIDILLTRQLDNGGKKDLATDVILQNIVVLAIDQLKDEEREKPQVARTATVEVSPEEAQKLALAMQVGNLSLALRNVVAVEPVATDRIGVSDLVEEEARAPTLVVLRGAARN
ncbi:MAG: Flp pilus assembly protein CpaB [Geminicoccaceae bacterium]